MATGNIQHTQDGFGDGSNMVLQPERDLEEEVDELHDRLDLLKHELHKTRNELLDLHDQQQMVVKNLIKACKQMEKAVIANSKNVERLTKNQKQIVKLISKK